MNAAVRAAAAVLLAGWSLAWAETRLPESGAASDLRYRYGIPNAIRIEPTGAQVWEYNDWRHGPRAFVLRFEGTGQLAGARWLRTPEDVARVAAEGLAAREALALLGVPHTITAGPEGLTWRYRQPAGPALQVRFGADGRVSAIEPAR